MTEPPEHRLLPVAPLLDPGEKVWAVYAGTGGFIMATDRRLFLPDAEGITPVPLAEFSAVSRVTEGLVMLHRVDGPSIRIPVEPDDERGLQALTVMGLLIAAAHAPAPAGPAPRGRRPLRRSSAAMLAGTARARRRPRPGTRPGRG